MSDTRTALTVLLVAATLALPVGAAAGVAPTIPVAPPAMAEQVQVLDLTLAPLKHLRACRKAAGLSRAQKRRVTAAIRVAKIAKKQGNHAGFYATKCGRALVLAGTGKAKRVVLRAAKNEAKRAGLKTRWRTVPNTRAEVRRDLRRVSKDPRVAWVEIPLTGAKLLIGTGDEELYTATRNAQREELGLTVHRFEVRDSVVPLWPWSSPMTKRRAQPQQPVHAPGSSPGGSPASSLAPHVRWNAHPPPHNEEEAASALGGNGL